MLYSLHLMSPVKSCSSSNQAEMQTLQTQIESLYTLKERREEDVPVAAAVAAADWLSVWHGAQETAWQTPWPQECLQDRL